MALSFSQFPFRPSKMKTAEMKKWHFPPHNSRSASSFPITPRQRFISKSTKLNKIFASKPLNFTTVTKASQEEDNTATSGKIAGPDAENQPRKSENEEIKKSMKERGGNEEVGFLSGVAEEIREIEWPSFNKVLGTTGVVLGVIAGSSVVLLIINAVLAELSDRVFAGKGVQDFFGW